MNNIYFFINDEIYDETTNEIINYDDIKKQLNNDVINLNNTDDYLDKYELLCNYYNENYTVNYLKHISQYYKIKNARKKIDIIENIVSFELNPNNYTIVNKRMKLWDYINELQNDKYFSKFIHF
jgi:hypothetical protein